MPWRHTDLGVGVGNATFAACCSLGKLPGSLILTLQLHTIEVMKPLRFEV